MVQLHSLTPVIEDVVSGSGGRIDPARLASSLGLTMTGLAELARVHRNTLTRSPGSPKVQASLTPIVRILAEAAELMGGDAARARLWFTTQPMGGFEGETAADIVRMGHPDAVRTHLQILRDGTYS